MSKCRIVNNRRIYKNDFFSHFVWNLFHPNDPIYKGSGFVIHHKDKNPMNDNILNLDKITKSEHNHCHPEKLKNFRNRPMSEEIKLKISKAKMGHFTSDKTKKKISEKMANRRLSESHKRKISLACKKRKRIKGRFLANDVGE